MQVFLRIRPHGSPSGASLVIFLHGSSKNFHHQEIGNAKQKISIVGNISDLTL